MCFKTKIVSGLISFSCAIVVFTTSTYAASINATNVNFRTSPSLNSKVITMLDNGDKVSVIGKSGSWAKIKADGKTGYVKASYVKKDAKKAKKASKSKKKTKAKTAYCTASSVNLRKSASMSGKVITRIDTGDKVKILGSKGTWYKVKVGGKTGYVAKAYIGSKKKTSKSKVSRGNSSNKGQKIVDYAKKFLGTRYVYGGTSPSGFDCSGLVYYCYQHMGVTLNRSATGQASNGRKIKKGNLKPGDIVLFSRGGSTYFHSGIYIGGGKMIHAEPKSGVNIDSIWGVGFYNQRYAGARRIFN